MARGVLVPRKATKHVVFGVAVVGASVARMQGFDVAAATARLADEGGGYEVVHESPGLEIGVYVLVAPEPDRQTPHRYDEVYVVLEGEGDIDVEGETRHVTKGDAVFVGAHAEHRFSGYDTLSLLVIFNGPHTASKNAG
jgi:mannose-6-phosphate isomerase-like protein (cupin superfamily)